MNPDANTPASAVILSPLNPPRNGLIDEETRQLMPLVVTPGCALPPPQNLVPSVETVRRHIERNKQEHKMLNGLLKLAHKQEAYLAERLLIRENG